MVIEHWRGGGGGEKEGGRILPFMYGKKDGNSRTSRRDFFAIFL